jgi:hypothetical protein
MYLFFSVQSKVLTTVNFLDTVEGIEIIITFLNVLNMRFPCYKGKGLFKMMFII